MRRTMRVPRGHMRGALVATALLGLLCAPAPSAGAALPEFASGRLAHGAGSAIVVLGPSFEVARLRPEGGLDPGFGRGGVARVRLPGYLESRSVDAAAQPDGKVLVGGYVTTPPCRGGCLRHLVLVRYARSGRLDRRFAHGGVLVTRWGGEALSVAALPGGGALVAGRTAGGYPLVARFRPDGRLDRSFADRGRRVLSRVPGVGALHWGEADRIAVDSDGSATLSLYGGLPDLRVRGLVRLTTAGRFDSRFGDGGFVTSLPPARFTYGCGFVALPDGRVLVALIDPWPTRRIELVRLLADGTVDPTYGEAGVALGPESFVVRSNVEPALLADGSALVAASGYGGSALAAFGPEGGLDRSFADDGVTPLLESWGARASLEPLADGSVALADERRETSGMVVGRYAANGTRLFSETLP
jgi:uncharacterized delta-60 repeat protein